MAKRFQHLCADSRIMTPLCKHLSFDKVAVCVKKVKLAQVGVELGPDDGLACEHFCSVNELCSVKEPEKKSEKKSRKKKRKSVEKDTLEKQDISE